MLTSATTIIGGSLPNHDLAGDRQGVKDGGGLRKARCGMSNESKFQNDGIVLLLVSPPLFLILLNLFHAFLGPERFFSNDPAYMDLEARHFLGYWIWLWLIPYVLLFIPDLKNGISIVVQIAICISTSLAFWDVFLREYHPEYVFLILTTTIGLMYFLYFDKFDFSSWKEFIKKFKPNYGPYPLRLGPKSSQVIPTDSLHMNVQVVGGTGTGKTHFVLKPLLEQTIKQGLGCFVYDVKGNLAPDVRLYLNNSAKSYYDRRTMFHFDLNNYSYSHTYNPLFGDDPDAIANRIYTALYYDTRNSEPYYRELAEMFLKNLISLLKKKIGAITFQDLLLATQETDTFRSIQLLCAEDPKSDQAFYFKSQWLSKTPKQRREELLGLINKLQRFCNSEWAPLVNSRNPDIKMNEVFEGHQVFLFSPNAARYPEDAKALSIMAMMDLSEQVADRYYGEQKKPFRVFLDEFYNLAYPRFIDFINKCREAKVNILLFHQSLGDLRSVSDEFMEQVMNTARNKIILGLDDPETAEYFARQFGTVRDTGYKVESYGKDGNMVGYSKPPVEKFLFHPNRIKSLKTGQAIVKVVGPNGPNVFPVQLSSATANPNHHPSKPSRTGWDKKNESGLKDYLKGRPGFDNPKDDGLEGLMGV